MTGGGDVIISRGQRHLSLSAVHTSAGVPSVTLGENGSGNSQQQGGLGMEEKSKISHPLSPPPPPELTADLAS